MPSDVMKMKCSAGTHVNDWSIMYIGKQLKMDSMLHASEYIYLYPYLSVYLYITGCPSIFHKCAVPLLSILWA